MVDKLDTTTIFNRTLMGLWKGSCMKSIFRYKIPLDHPVLPFSRNNEASENRCWGGGLGAGDCSVRFHHNRCQIPLSGAVPWERFLSLSTLAVTEISFWIKLLYLPPCFMLRQPKRYLLVLDQKEIAHREQTYSEKWWFSRVVAFTLMVKYPLNICLSIRNPDPKLLFLCGNLEPSFPLCRPRPLHGPCLRASRETDF